MVAITNYEFFEMVYLKTDPYQHPRQITNIELNPGPNSGIQIVYLLCFNSTTSRHYELEFTREKDTTKTVE